MRRAAYLGEFEQTVLLAVLRLGDHAYGVTVRREIGERTGRDVSLGAIYATLDRLEAKRMVRSGLGEPTAARGGRAKRLFTVTALGTKSVAEAQRALRQMVEGLDLLRSFS